MKSGFALVMAGIYLALIVAIGVFAIVDYNSNEFLEVWHQLGIVVGVLVGFGPALLFAVSARGAQTERDKVVKERDLAWRSFQALLAVSDQGSVEQAKDFYPKLFDFENKPRRPS